MSCRRDALLALPLAAYKAHANNVEAGFREAAGFLNEHSIIWHKDIPYPPLVSGLASTFAILGVEGRSAAAKAKVARWFWSVTLGELFGSSTESRLARDVVELVDWVRGAETHPRALDEAVFQEERLRTLRTRVAAAYKGIHALLMRSGCQDFITGRRAEIMTFFNDQIDIHHVFPKAWCKAQGIEPAVFNSIVNKTPLSRRSNASIGGDAPSVYLARIEEEEDLTQANLDAILASHLIDPKHLRNDDFDAFFNARLRALSALVADAMGKPVVIEVGANEPETDVQADVDDDFEELDPAA